jgi:phosphate-selective porin OprO and OprP
MRHSFDSAAVAGITVALFVAALTPQVSAQVQDDLRKRVDDLEQQLRVLKRQLELDKEAAAEKAKTAPLISAGASGFAIQSADTNFVLRLRGGLQADGRFYAGDSTATDTFLLRRVRPIIEGTVYEKFDYRLMFDFASGVSLSAANNGSLLDAYGDLRLYPEFNIRAGKFKEPVGLERLQSWNNLLFVERGFPTQLLPNRDVGVMIHGELFDGHLNYQLGVFNGTADGGSNDFDTSDSDKDVAARLLAHPFRNSDRSAFRGLGFGIAGTFGEQTRTPRTYTTHGSQRFFGYRSGIDPTRPNVLGDGTQWRLTPQAYYYWGPFGVLGEYAISSQELVQAGGGTGAGSTSTLRNYGWQVGASYFVTGEDNSFRAVNPRRPFTLDGEGWGALELTARVGELNPDDAAFPIFADPASSAARAFSWGLGANWHLNRFFKVTFNYENTDLNGLDSRYTGLDHEHVFLTRLQATY